MLSKYKNYQPDLPGCLLFLLIWALFSTFAVRGVGVIFPTLPEIIAFALGVVVSTSLLVTAFFRLRSIPLIRLFSPSFAQAPVVGLKILLLVILLSCCVSIISSFIMDMLKFFEIGRLPDFNPLAKKISVEQLPSEILTALVLAPLIEEIVFTGIILRGLLHHRSPLYAIVVSSVMFGVLHILNENALYATLGGIATGWLYWRTRSLWPAILAHLTNNIIALSTGLVWSTIPQFVFYLLLALGLLMLPVVIIQIHTLTRVPDGEN